jgi:glycerophosphoryl diester phosphodiesterase
MGFFRYVKKILSWLLVFLLATVLLYYMVMLALGGYGKKPANFFKARNKDSVLYFAHRGIPAYFPESSKKSIDAAIRIGFTAVEVDVQESLDGVLVIFHDDDCRRLLGRNKTIAEMTVKEIQRPGIRLNKKETGSHVLTVTQLVETYKDRLAFYFDMKIKDFRAADKLVKIIRQYGIEKTSIVANSHFPTVFYIEWKYPDINTALEGYDAGKEWTYYLMPKRLKPDFFSSFYWRAGKEHLVWLKAHTLMDSRIVYGVQREDISYQLGFGMKNLIIDYDSAITGYPEMAWKSGLIRAMEGSR